MDKLIEAANMYIRTSRNVGSSPEKIADITEQQMRVLLVRIGSFKCDDVMSESTKALSSLTTSEFSMQQREMLIKAIHDRTGSQLDIGSESDRTQTHAYPENYLTGTIADLLADTTVLEEVRLEKYVEFQHQTLGLLYPDVETRKRLVSIFHVYAGLSKHDSKCPFIVKKTYDVMNNINGQRRRSNVRKMKSYPSDVNAFMRMFPDAYGQEAPPVPARCSVFDIDAMAKKVSARGHNKLLKEAAPPFDNMPGILPMGMGSLAQPQHQSQQQHQQQRQQQMMMNMMGMVMSGMMPGMMPNMMPNSMPWGHGGRAPSPPPTDGPAGGGPSPLAITYAETPAASANGNSGQGSLLAIENGKVPPPPPSLPEQVTSHNDVEDDIDTMLTAKGLTPKKACAADDANDKNRKKRKCDVDPKPKSQGSKKETVKGPCNLAFPGKPTKVRPPIHWGDFTIVTDFSSSAWRVKHPSFKSQKTAVWNTNPKAAWERVLAIINSKA